MKQLRRASGTFAAAAAALALGLSVANVSAQQGQPAPQGAAGQQGPAGQQGAAPAAAGQAPGAQAAAGAARAPRALTVPYDAADTTGFVRIFDGTLRNWDGDPTFWRADSMMIIGESTPTNRVASNNFLIWRGGTLRDFELKVEVRLNETNSGIQIRSKERPELGKWVMSGYQLDMDFANNYPGNIFEERGRGFMAPRGQATMLNTTGARPNVIASLGSDLEMKGLWNTTGWNQYHIIGRGPVITMILNGRVTGIFYDYDPAAQSLEGLLGFQMHTGPPFRVQYRNIFLRQL